MPTAVNDWKQQGRVFVWRYPPHRRKHEGWHLTADAGGCDSLARLIEAMRAAPRPTRRTVRTSRATAPVWAVPNFGEPRKETPPPLTLRFEPGFTDLTLTEEDGRLVLRIGHARADELVAALEDVGRGGGDYALAPHERGAGPRLWFWWMLAGGGEQR